MRALILVSGAQLAVAAATTRDWANNTMNIEENMALTEADLRQELAWANEAVDLLVAALKPLREGIAQSVWHDINGERMKRILVAETAIERIDHALEEAHHHRHNPSRW